MCYKFVNILRKQRCRGDAFISPRGMTSERSKKNGHVHPVSSWADVGIGPYGGTDVPAS